MAPAKSRSAAPHTGEAQLRGTEAWITRRARPRKGPAQAGQVHRAAGAAGPPGRRVRKTASERGMIAVEPTILRNATALAIGVIAWLRHCAGVASVFVAATGLSSRAIR